ncbi:MAG: SGNH hydrolase domain-containing protein, partial [Nocardioidaceae bacterium]
LTLVGCLTAHLMVQQEVTAASSAPPITVHHFGGGKKAEPRFSRDPAIALVQASVRAARNGLAIPGGLNPPLMDLRDDNADVGECEYGNDIRTVCERGVVGSHHVMILVGDSHARAWVPALDRIALREGFAVYYFVKPDCGAAEVVVGADADTRPSRYEGCLKWQTWARDTIRDLDPDVTLVSSDMTPGDVGFASQATEIDDDVADQIRLGLHQAVSDLKLISGRLVVIGDVPGLRELPGSCLAARGANLADCASPPNALWSTALSITRDVARADGVEFINPFRWFCADQLCPAVVGSTVTYRDQGHISTTYSAQLADPLAEALALSSGR